MNIPLDNKVRFGDGSLQAVDCTGTDGQIHYQQRMHVHRKLILQTNWPWLSKKTCKMQKTWINTCKNCSFQYAYDCAQTSYTIQHRTALIIFPLMFQRITMTNQ